MSVTSNSVHFSDREEKLYNMLSREPRDVKMSVLFRVIAGRWPESTESVRAQQQRLGPYISRMNKKLVARRQLVAPGVHRHTYRLVHHI
jgi:hypothetical protein